MLDLAEDNLLKILMKKVALLLQEIREMISISWLLRCNYSSKKPAKENEI